MIDRTERVQHAIGDCINHNFRTLNMFDENLKSNLGSLHMLAVMTGHKITVGRIELPRVRNEKVGRGYYLSAFIHDGAKKRQLWIPYSSVDEGVTDKAEIVATEEETIMKGWFVAQPLLVEVPNSEQTIELLGESITLLKTIGAIALEPADRIVSPTT